MEREEKEAKILECMKQISEFKDIVIDILLGLLC